MTTVNVSPITVNESTALYYKIIDLFTAYDGAKADMQSKIKESKKRETELCNTIEIQKKEICILNKDLEFIKLQRDTDRQIFDLQLRILNEKTSV